MWTVDNHNPHIFSTLINSTINQVCNPSSRQHVAVAPEKVGSGEKPCPSSPMTPWMGQLKLAHNLHHSNLTRDPVTQA